jgi:uncharacterized membrane protein
MFTFMLVIQRMMSPLSAPEYTRIMQGLIRGADDPPIVPLIVVISMLAPLVTLIKLRHARNSTVWKMTFIGWLVFVIGVFGITIGINAPINNQILKWPMDAPPADWMALRDRWNNINWIRTPASGLSFVLFMLTLAYPLPEDSDRKTP